MKTKRITFLARRGNQSPRRITFAIQPRKSTDELWIEIYDLIESKTEESKYTNPIVKDNPYYRSGVNDGLRVALSKMDKPRIAFLANTPPPKRTIKSPPKPRRSSFKAIKEAVKRSPPKRVGLVASSKEETHDEKKMA